MLCGVRGICVRGNFNFRRLVFSGVGISIGLVVTVMGFTAKMPGGWPLLKSVPGKLSFFRGIWSSNATWMARGKNRSATTPEFHMSHVLFLSQSVFSEGL